MERMDIFLLGDPLIELNIIVGFEILTNVGTDNKILKV